jgi:hypothetical protein
MDWKRPTAYNPDQFHKRVKALYGGPQDTFSFYNQLTNASAQWGVNLKILQNVRNNMTLCPDIYNGALVTEEYYQTMTALLYEYLSCSDVISIEHKDTQRVINRLSDKND